VVRTGAPAPRWTAVSPQVWGAWVARWIIGPRFSEIRIVSVKGAEARGSPSAMTRWQCRHRRLVLAVTAAAYVSALAVVFAWWRLRPKMT
jgi:hypothetical protein